MKPNTATATLLLTAAFRALQSPEESGMSGVFLDDKASAAIATDGDIIAILPFPKGSKLEEAVQIPHGTDDLELQLQDGSAIMPDGLEAPLADTHWGWSTIEEAAKASPSTYHILIDARKLASLAAALGSEVIALRISTPDAPIMVHRADQDTQLAKVPHGYLMPHGGDGLLISPPAAAAAPGGPVTAEVRVIDKEGLKALEVHFTGKPDKPIREALKASDLGFRWSGDKGTRRGISPKCWYGPDNAYTRQRVGEIVGEAVPA